MESKKAFNIFFSVNYTANCFWLAVLKGSRLIDSI